MKFVLKKHIFFDLDRTLWDFETNSHETLLEIYNKYNLRELGIESHIKFIEEYKKINERLWEMSGLLMLLNTTKVQKAIYSAVNVMM